MTIPKKEITPKVLEIIKTDPGVSARHIQALLPGVDSKKISASLAYHRREKRIQNRGKAARGASWYPTS